MTHDDVRGWIDAYGAAIGDLFAEDATYPYYPYDEGRGAVVHVPSGGPHGTPVRTPGLVTRPGANAVTVRRVLVRRPGPIDVRVPRPKVSRDHDHDHDTSRFL